MGEMVAEQRLAGGAHAEAVLQRLGAAHRHPGHLGGKALHMVFFLLQQAFGDEQRHGYVLVPCGLKARVQQMHDVFPDGIAVRPQNDAALDGGIIHQLCFQADVGIPLGEIFVDGGDGLHHFFVLAHCFDSSSFPFAPQAHKKSPAVRMGDRRQADAQEFSSI